MWHVSGTLVEADVGLWPGFIFDELSKDCLLYQVVDTVEYTAVHLLWMYPGIYSGMTNVSMSGPGYILQGTSTRLLILLILNTSMNNTPLQSWPDNCDLEVCPELCVPVHTVQHPRAHHPRRGSGPIFSRSMS